MKPQRPQKPKSAPVVKIQPKSLDIIKPKYDKVEKGIPTKLSNTDIVFDETKLSKKDKKILDKIKTDNVLKKANTIEDPNIIIDSLIEQAAPKKKEKETPLILEEEKIEKIIQKPIGEWDIPLSEPIDYFDADLSYELTGYKPINNEKGLDFDPSWFTEARESFLNTHHYCQYFRKSKAYNDFWHQEYVRCREGMTVNGYTITGDNYFFLNYYQLDDLTSTNKAGGGRSRIFPNFFVEQYKWFHYLELCKLTRRNAALMKARGVGFSEMDAALLANSYSCRKNTVNVVAAQQEVYLTKTLDKIWKALDFLNDSTDGGFFKLRQAKDNDKLRKATYYEIIEGQKVEKGWGSQIQGIVADKPNKIRGDRTDLLFYEEGGCHAPGTKVIMYDGTTKNVEDVEVGDFLVGPDNLPREVLELHRGTDNMYEVTPANKHLTPQIVNSKHVLYGTFTNHDCQQSRVFAMTVKRYYDDVTTYDPHALKDLKYKMNICQELHFPHKDVPIDPYIYGQWLGEGCNEDCDFYSYNGKTKKYLIDFAKSNGYDYSVHKYEVGIYAVHIYKIGLTYNPLYERLMEIGSTLNEIYIVNDKHTKQEVIRGLLAAYNSTKIVLYDDILLDNIARIARRCGIYPKKISNGLILSNGLHKIKGYKNSKILKKQTSFRVKNLKYEGEYYGFTLDGDHLYVLDDMAVCHNSWPNSTKAFIQGDALVGAQGNKFGIKLIGGTGGDSGKNLEGLRLIYEQPTVYEVLPFRHNYTSTGVTVCTGFFIPAFNVVNITGLLDKRGYTNPELGKQYYDLQRGKKASDQKALMTYVAEFCYTAEEAFSLEGENKFNKVNIVQQLTKIRILKECPPIQTGSFNLTNNNGAVTGSIFIPSKHGKVKILESPISENGVILDNLYVAGIDGIDIGAAQTSSTTKDPSDFCIVIVRRAYGLRGPQIVATYKDRPDSERDAYKIAMGLMMYYKAKANIEASRVSMLTWAKDKKCYNWFIGRPSSTYQDINRKKSTTVGTPATPAIINHQTDLIKDFIDDYYEELWFEDILDELNRYSDENKRKFDYVAALGMALLADEEYNIRSIVPKNTTPQQVVTSHLGYYTDERGYRRYGIIPDQPQHQAMYSDDSIYYINGNSVRSSDPRDYM